MLRRRCRAELRNQLRVRCGKVQRVQVGAGYPTHFLAKPGMWHAGERAGEEVQLDGAFGVSVRDAVDLAADIDGAAKFFVDLARQAVSQRLVVSAFSAREFPEAFEMRAAWTPRQEESIVLFDHRRGHDQVLSHVNPRRARVRG